MKTINFFFLAITFCLLSFNSPNKLEIDISNYGAIGDGITNNVVPLQSALNALKQNGGGTLFFPPGKYVVTDTFNEFAIDLRYFQDITIKANSPFDTEIIGMHGANASKGLFYLFDFKNLRFENLTIRGEHSINLDTVTAESLLPNYNMVSAFNITGNAENINFQNCHIKYFGGPAINIYGNSKTINFQDCDLTGFVKDLNAFANVQPNGILIRGNGPHDNINIVDCNFYNFIDISGTNNAHGLYFRNCKNVTVDNCFLSVTGKYDTDNLPNGGIQIFSGQSRFVNVTNCTFENVTNYSYSCSFANWANNDFIDSRIHFQDNYSQLVNNRFLVTNPTANEGIVYVGFANSLKIFQNSFYHEENASVAPFNPLAIRLNQNTSNILIRQNEFNNFNVGIMIGKGTSTTNPETYKNILISENIFFSGPNSAYGIDLRACQDCVIKENIGWGNFGESLALIVDTWQGEYFNNNFFKDNIGFGTCVYRSSHF